MRGQNDSSGKREIFVVEERVLGATRGEIRRMSSAFEHDDVLKRRFRKISETLQDLTDGFGDTNTRPIYPRRH
jgi:hypothetical protein